MEQQQINNKMIIKVLDGIRDQLIAGNHDDAVSDAKRVVTSFGDIIEVIHYLENSVIAFGLKDRDYNYFIKSIFKILLDKITLEAFFISLVVYFEKSSSALSYYIEHHLWEDLKQYIRKDNEASVQIIDTKERYNKNIEWLSIYNKKLLNDFFGKTNPPNSNCTYCGIKAAVKINKKIYYQISDNWLCVDPGVYNLENNNTPVTIYYVEDISFLEFLIGESDSSTKYVKNDMYIIIHNKTLYPALELLLFSDVEKGNFRVNFLLESRWKQRLAQYSRLGYTFPVNCIANKNKFDEIMQFMKQYRDNNNDKANKKGNILKKVYDQSFFENLKKRKFNKIEQIRILLLTSRHTSYGQYACETLDKGFKKLGCKSMLFRENKYQGAGSSIEFFFRVIMGFAPDLIVSINNFRHDHIREYMPGIPFVAWIHDYPETLPRPCTTVSDTDFIFAGVELIAKSLLPETFPVLKNCDIHLLPFVRDIQISEDYKHAKTYDVSYIANLKILPEILSYYAPEKTGTYQEKLVHRLLDKLKNAEPVQLSSIYVSEKESVDLLTKTIREIGGKEVTDLNKDHFLVKDILKFGVLTFLNKTTAIRYLIKNGVDNILLGGHGWDQLEYFKPFAAGMIPHDKLSEIISKTRINLNLTSAISFHPKVGEVLEANGFLISSWKGDFDAMPVTNFFKEDEEVILFKSYEELLTKVKYFLKHGDEREAITKRARKKFVNNFSAEQGCREMLNTVLSRTI